MGNLKRRVDKVEATLEDKTGDKYRELCFHYNLHLANDADLCESLLCIFEDRPMDPEVNKRLYAPIPPNAPKRLIQEALMSRDRRDDSINWTQEKWEQEYLDTLDYKCRCESARKLWLKDEHKK